MAENICTSQCWGPFTIYQKQRRGGGFWFLSAIKFTKVVIVCWFKKLLMPGKRYPPTPSAIRSWLLFTTSGALDEIIRLTAPSRSPNPVKEASTDPTTTLLTKRSMFKFPSGRVLNCAVAFTTTWWQSMTTLPSPEIGTVMRPESIFPWVVWEPSILSVGMVMVNVMIKPIKRMSNSFIHIFFWPVTSAFLIRKSILISDENEMLIKLIGKSCQAK